MSITNRITGDQKISGFVNIYNQNNENIENALKEYKDDYKKLDSEIKGKFDNELKRIKNNLTSDVVNLNQTINKFEEKIEKISEGFQSKVEGKINSVVDDFRKDYKNDIDNIKVEIQSDILSSVNEDLQKYDGKLDNVKETINTTITTLENKHDEDIKNISSDVKGLQGKIYELNKNIRNHQSDINTINKSIKNLGELFEFKTDTNNKLDEIGNRIDDIQGIVNDLQSSVQGVQTVALDELKKLDEHIETHVHSYLKKDEGVKETIKESLNDVKDEYINDVQQTIENFKKQIEQFEDFDYVLKKCKEIDYVLEKCKEIEYIGKKLDYLKGLHGIVVWPSDIIQKEQP